MNKYQKPEINNIKFDVEDVITTSGVSVNVGGWGNGGDLGGGEAVEAE